jgi:hypothetical protein
VQFTPIGFQLQPTLTATQTISIQPVSQLTYRFTDSGGHPASPDVILNGTDQGQQSSVTFTPGKDTVGIRFDGNPITVNPSWDFKEVLTNEVDLDATLDATLTVGEVSATLPVLGTVTAGPLHQQHFTFANTRLLTLFNQTSTILDQIVPTGTASWQLPSFPIGANFKSSTVVNTFNDNNAPDQNLTDANGVPLNNSLRDAILKANTLSTPTVIRLGAGTYNLTLPPNGTEDGRNGDLLFKASQLTIQGAGAGQTMIRANFPAGQFDRVFHVTNGASLTLNGLTIEDGNPQDSSVAVGEGGGILQDSGTILDIENCTITGNQAVAGGGIYSSNTWTSWAESPVDVLTIHNSTISNNTVTGQPGANGQDGFTGQDGGAGQVGGAGQGGGIYADLTGVGLEANIENSTFSGNVAVGGQGGSGGSGGSSDFFSGDPAGNGGTGGNGGNGEGGGLYVKQTIFINVQGVIDGNNCLLINDTFTSNSATGGAGGPGGRGGSDIFGSDGSPGNPGNGGNGLGGAVRINEVPDPSGVTVYPDALLNDTIASNRASGGQPWGFPGVSGSGQGGGVYTQPTSFPNPPEPRYSVEAQNTILAGNSADQGPDMEGDISSGGTNLIGDTSGITLNRSSDLPPDLLNKDPQLAPLGNYGGPTQTMAIAPDSLAFDAGQNVSIAAYLIPPFPTTDQRGYARTTGGHTDIGAFQYQYDLTVTGSEVFTSSTTDTVRYSFTVTNNGPEAANNVILTDPLPAHTSSAIGLPPSGWNFNGSNGTVTFTDTNPLAAGQSATFSVFATLIVSGSPVGNTATVTPSTSDNNPANNQVTLTVLNPNEGQWLQNAVLFHVASPGPSYVAGNFSASVGWGDSSPGNNSLDGTGTVAVVASAGGGFDVVGSHRYTDEGNYAVAVNVTYLSAAALVQANVAGQTLSTPLSAPLPTPNGKVQNMVLYHFTDPNSADTAASYVPFIFWGDVSASGPSGGASVVADPAGGFDVVGSHTFASNVVGAVNFAQPLGPLAVTGPSLLHFTGSAPTAANQFTVNWGDGTSSTASGPYGNLQVGVFSNPAGGYDVAGNHVYTQGVGSLSGTVLVAVADALLTAVALTPPPMTLQQQLNQTVLYHFLDPNAALRASAFTATVHWGNGTSNTSSDGSGSVSVVASAAGGFDVIGTHTYGAGVVGAVSSVQVVDSQGRVFSTPVLFHFTDGNPLATAADFTATVHWGDGASNTSADGTGSVFVVANPLGGFDVLGSHTYTQSLRNATFSVQVADDGGAFTSASTSTFSVDYPLTPGTLTTPAITTEGQKISSALLFHFTDGDSQGQASDFLATVVWGDGSSNTSGDGTSMVRVSANTQGGFDVLGSHTFGDVPSGAAFGVRIQDASGAETGASTTSFTVADPAVQAAGSYTVTANEGSDSGSQTVATFTDPAGVEAVANYSASINWGDGTPTTPGTISVNAGTFTVQGHHRYGQEGSYPISVTINHGTASAVVASSTATVADPAVKAAGNFSVTAVEGQTTGSQTVATFTDPGGAEALAAYQATINWGDTGSSAGVIGVNRNSPFTFASHLGAGTGPSAALLADLDGTGILDLVVANAGDHTVEVFLGNGDGTFQNPEVYSLDTANPPTTVIPTALAVGDLTGTGKLDIVTANSNKNTVSILLNDGSGAFHLGQTLTAGSNPSGVAVADLNGDHNLDVVTANQGSNNVSVFLGNGNGTFQSPQTFAVGGTSPVAVAVGKLNGDTANDLVVADAGSNQVSVLLGNGNGSFQAAQTLAVDSYPAAVTLADLASNGKLDIVTANTGGNDVSVLMGNGNGTFQVSVNYPTGTAPVAVLVRDAFGNGKLDIITANNSSNNVSVLAGKGDGTFQPATTYALSTGASAPTALAAGDLSGAGVLDLVTANALSNDVTLLLPPYTVTGSHTYQQASGANPDVISVTVQHGGTTSTPVTSGATVADATLTVGTLTPPHAVTGTPFTNVNVFHFTDADPNAVAGDYAAVVGLGDGTSVTLTSTPGSNGQVVANANGGFDVQLSYTYATHGSMTFAVQVIDHSGGRTLTDPSDSTASASTTFIVLAVPTITWSNPAPVTYGTALSTVQLNASASVPGTFSYTPAAGTVLPAGTQTLSVTFTPSDTGNYGTATATVTLTVNPAPLNVLSVQVNDGSAQRSMVTSVTVTFSQPVTLLDPGAFEIRTGTTSLFPTDLTISGNQVVIRFTGLTGVVAGSLADGRYTLIEHQGKIHGGPNYLVQADHRDAFFRLYGDVNGDARVDNTDRTAFLAAYRSRKGMANYCWYFDVNNDGFIDSVDYYQFQQRYGSSLAP